MKIPSLTPVETLGFFIQPRFWTLKTHDLFTLSKSCFFFKECKDFRFTLYQNLRCNHLSKSWVLLIRTIFFDTKNSWPTWLVKISGFLKSAKILGLHCIKIRGLTPVKILGYFSRTRFFNSKTVWPVWLVKISGFLRSRKIWTYIVRNSRCKTCHNLGVFIRTSFFFFFFFFFFDNKSLYPTWLVKILGFFSL